MAIETAALPPRERILKAADELFYRLGIRAVGVDAIAEAAGTNKMTLYRHFPSKDDLVAEYLRQKGKRAEALWERLEAEHPGDPRAQLHAWVKHMAEEGRVAVRNHRRGARHELEGLEKDGEISSDEIDRAEKELDKVTAANVAAIDAALEHKERELLGD